MTSPSITLLTSDRSFPCSMRPLPEHHLCWHNALAVSPALCIEMTRLSAFVLMNDTLLSSSQLRYLVNT
ncbi:hypothetical protein Y024_4522 [Burkholderia pseudomallei TSV44]|nr:hypothetical protein Y024_4522 [Burkholderia pseudomallei TSV44]